MNYLTEVYSLDKLRQMAANCDRVRQNRPLLAMTFLQMADIIPWGIEWKRGNQIPQTRLNPSAIPAKYLAEVAHDWDKDGETTATEFVDALAFEVAGTDENSAVSEVTVGLGRE